MDELKSLKEEKYQDFVSGIIPNISKDQILGVRLPLIRKLAKKVAGSDETRFFLASLPHTYLEENYLHGFLIEKEKDFDTCIALVEAYLPYIDNWANCDGMKPKCFEKNKEKLLPYIKKWLKSNHAYTVRYAIEMLMVYYLDEDFKQEYLDWVAMITSSDYYVKMMIAWYFATALSKQYDASIIYIEKHKLEKWTHNKTIQKAVESYRIDEDSKLYLKSLRVK